MLWARGSLGRGRVVMGWLLDTETREHWARARGTRGRRHSRGSMVTGHRRQALTAAA